MPRQGSINKTLFTGINESLFVTIPNNDASQRIAIIHLAFGKLPPGNPPFPSIGPSSLYVYQNKVFGATDPLMQPLGPPTGEDLSSLLYYIGVGDTYEKQVVDFQRRPILADAAASVLIVWTPNNSGTAVGSYLTVLGDYVDIGKSDRFLGYELR